MFVIIIVNRQFFINSCPGFWIVVKFEVVIIQHVGPVGPVLVPSSG